MAFLRWLVIPICIVCLASLLLAQRPPSDDEKEKMRLKIGITKEQQAQFEAIFTDEQKQDREIRDKERELYGQLRKMYEDYSFDRNQAMSIRRELGGLYRKRLFLHSETQEKMRKILTREQFDRMTAAMKEMREKWMREHPRRGPGGPPPNGAAGPPACSRLAHKA